MRHTEAWICDLCGAAHKTEEDARACENKHPITGNIVHRRFEMHDQYPSKISIQFDDGEIIDYDFSGHGSFERY